MVDMAKEGAEPCVSTAGSSQAAVKLRPTAKGAGNPQRRSHSLRTTLAVAPRSHSLRTLAVAPEGQGAGQ